MWVKICANTNLKDAALAAELGADAVGFVFAPSKRQVTAAQVAAITSHLPTKIEKAGVFASRGIEEIARTVTEAGLTAVQLHGGLDEELIYRLRDRFGERVKLIQTLHWVVTGADGDTADDDVARQIDRVAALGEVDRILIDSKVGAASGGTGIAFDWDRAARVFAEAPSGLHLIVAGGLKPENVSEAIRRISPWGVDVASGVEAVARRKDPERLRVFIENARMTN